MTAQKRGRFRVLCIFIIRRRGFRADNIGRVALTTDNGDISTAGGVEARPTCDAINGKTVFNGFSHDFFYVRLLLSFSNLFFDCQSRPPTRSDPIVRSVVHPWPWR